MYNKSAELRAMFIDTLTKVTQGCISHTPLRMIQVPSDAVIGLMFSPVIFDRILNVVSLSFSYYNG